MNVGNQSSPRLGLVHGLINVSVQLSTEYSNYHCTILIGVVQVTQTNYSETDDFPEIAER